jgi:hypothetical protein
MPFTRRAVLVNKQREAKMKNETEKGKNTNAITRLFKWLFFFFFLLICTHRWMVVNTVGGCNDSSSSAKRLADSISAVSSISGMNALKASSLAALFIMASC